MSKACGIINENELFNKTDRDYNLLTNLAFISTDTNYSVIH